MSDDENEVDEAAHKRLLKSVRNLGNVQHISKPSRSELISEQSEFNLTKPATNGVAINDIVQLLRRSSKHVGVAKKLKNIHNSKKVLEKPLEKPVANRIKRTVGYENVTKELGRWDALVAKNRSAETQVFPLPTETVYVNTAAHVSALKNNNNQSDLAKEFEALDEKLRALRKAQAGDTTDEKALEAEENRMLKVQLTRKELIAQRKELAYLKMRQSQKSAKERLQNKIKSKKYHKLLKRQKMLEGIKEFELLQKTNPEAALEKLDALEKSRALERASLRHKNTGTWAKNLQVRAKYDKDVRKDLAEQLAVSKQLTAKKLDEDSDEEQFDKKQPTVADDDEYYGFNPWTKGKEKSTETKENGEENPNWRKYWTERNENEKQLALYKEDIKVGKSENAVAQKKQENADTKSKKMQEFLKAKLPRVQKQVKKSKPVIENGWLVEEITEPPVANGKNPTLDDIFAEQEYNMRENLSKKLAKLNKRIAIFKKPISKKKILKKKKSKDELQNLNSLMFKNTKQRPDIDELLEYGEESANEPMENLQNILNKPKKAVDSAIVDTIDPNKLTSITLIQKKTLNDALDADDAEAGVDYDENHDLAAERQLTISEAFEDDDIVADFSKDKTQDTELKNPDLDLFMPGWGSWAGAGISQNVIKKRQERMLLKLAAPEKRRDDNKDNLYINENANKEARKHKVSSIPFPFKSLSDYEASIRAPIGRNFVTETAFRMMTRPAVITRKGAIIEPMDESQLVKPDRRLRNVVDRRIKHMQNTAQKKKPNKK